MWQRNPVAPGAMLLDVVLEHRVLLRRPWPLLHRRLVAAGCSSHLSLFLLSATLLSLGLSFSSSVCLPVCRRCAREELLVWSWGGMCPGFIGAGERA